MTTKPIGIYVHIPFCKQKCAYCDFVSFAGALEKYEEQYVNALVKEIHSYREEPKIKADTIFFGGGTPSVISASSFEKISSAIFDTFEIMADTEFTLEANPKTLTDEKILVYKACGVNRISLGLQSFCEKELKVLGRIHNFEDFKTSYEMCVRYGITNINVDLMYALPTQTIESLTRTLSEVASLSPAHISAYSLILEEGTRLFQEKEKYVFPSEDEECEMYLAITKSLADAGYLHYEISNYAKPGYESRHNLKYWHDEEYIGLGLAAHSYFGRKRYANPSSFSEYFSLPGREYLQSEEIDEVANAYEYAMMRLRLSEGFSLSEYKSLFGRDFLSGKEEYIARLVDEGYMLLSTDKIAFTEKGFYVSNEILSQIL